MRRIVGRGSITVLLLVAARHALPAQSPESEIRRLIGQAQQAEQREDLNAAAAAYRQILKLRPHWASAEFNLALVYHSQRQYFAAIALLNEVLGHNPALSDAHLFLGSSYFHTDQFTKARRSLERFAQEHPDSAEVRPLLGGTYYGLGDYRRALTAYLEIITDAPREAEPYYHAAESYLALVRECIRELSVREDAKYFYYLVAAERLATPEIAALNVREAQKLKPMRPEAYITEGQVLLRNGKALEAASAYEEARAIAPSDCRALEGLADARLALGQIAEAVRGAAAVLPLRPACLEDPPEGTLGLPREQFDDRIKALAAEASSAGRDFLLARWTKQERADPPCSNGAGPLVEASCREMRGDLGGATRAVFAARTRAPHDPETIYWALRLFLRLSQRSLESLESLAPDSPLLATMRGKIFEQAGNMQAAGEQYAKAAALTPGDAGSLAELAKFKCRNAQFDEAIPLLEKALSLEPDSARIKGLLGEAFMMKNQPEKALPFLRQAIRDNPESRQSRMYLAQALDRLDRTDEGIRVLEAAPYDPDGRVHYLLGQFHSHQGHSEEAAKAFRIFKERRKAGPAADVSSPEPP